MPPQTRFTAAHGGLAAVGLLWTLPFLQPIHRYPLTSFYSEWLAIVLGLVASAALLDRRCWREAPCPLITLFLSGLIALLAVQYWLGRVTYGGQALTAALYLGWAGLLMILARNLRREFGMTAVVTMLAWFLFAGGFLSAIVALAQHFQISTVLDPLIAPKRAKEVYGNLAQRNQFANYIALAFASLAYLYARGRMRGAAAVAGAVPLAFILGLSGSRSVLVYLTLTLALALPFSRRADVDSRRLLVCVTTFIIGSLVSQWLAGLPWLVPRGGAVTTVQRLFSETASVNERLQITREAWLMFLQSPLLGVGWGQFAWQEFGQRAQSGLTIAGWPFNNAHNILLQLLAETGLAGALLVVGMALLWLWGLKRVAFDLDRWWLLALLGVIGVHSLLEYPLWYAYFLGIAAVALGLGSERNFTAGFERAGPPAVLLSLAAGVIVAVPLFQGYREFERLFARDSAAPGAQEQAAILSRAHREFALRPYAEFAIALGIEPGGSRAREKAALNDRAMRFAPVETLVYRQALLLALAGRREEALRQFARAALVYPGELPSVRKTLRELAAGYPAELTPLLELAAADRAELRSRAASR